MLLERLRVVAVGAGPGFVALLIACSNGYGTDPEQPLAGCTGDVTVHVGAGTTPEFSWTPDCLVFFVLVEPAESGEDLWSVISEGANRIAPGVRYGTVPPGATEADPPTPLVDGTSYEVIVARYTGPGGDDGVQIGAAVFTP